LLRRLGDENSELKRLIGELGQRIAAAEAENLVLSSSIAYFEETIGDRSTASASDV
jgi:hypothetical protein